MRKKKLKKERLFRDLMNDPEKMGFNIEELRSDLSTDKYKLDQDWARIQNLYEKWVYEAAVAKYEFDNAWEDVKVIRAGLLEEAKDQGCTNADARESYYRQHPKHIAAKKKMTFCAARHYYLDKLILFGFPQKKAGLENLTRLWMSEYYSEPKATKEEREKLSETRRQRADKRVKTRKAPSTKTKE